MKLLLLLNLLFWPAISFAQHDFSTKCEIKHGNVYVSGTFDEDMVDCFMNAVLVTPKLQKMHITLNSPGGNMRAYHEILKIIKEDKRFKTITCEYCFSAAAFLFETAGLKRIMRTDSLLMFHQIRFVVNGQVTVDLLEQMMRELIKDNEQISDTVCKNITIPKEVFMKRITRDWFVDAEMAKQCGMVDRVYPAKEQK